MQKPISVSGGLRDILGGIGSNYANLGADGTFADDEAGEEADAEAEEESMRLRLLLENFDQQQQERYETFRRANLNKANIKKIANQALGHSITPNVAIAIGGFSKIFVGELVERARRVQAQWSESGPLTPEHLREAYRRYKMETNLTPDSRTPVRFK